MTTLGSPLADLGNLLLPFTIRPVEGPAKGGTGSNPPVDGLNGVSSEESGLPQREQLERWWVEGMNEGVGWQQQRSGGGLGVSQKWQWPISGMG